MHLTPAQQDYIEAIYRLASSQGSEEAVQTGVRVSDIAAHLGTKLPTVTRNMARLRELGLIEQQARGPVNLTEEGVALGSQLSHRHRDILQLLTSVLGVKQNLAVREACLLEHGMSGETSQRLHQFLLNWQGLDEKSKTSLLGKRKRRGKSEFSLVGPGAGHGGRQ